MATVLEVGRKAYRRLLGEEPVALFSSTDDTAAQFAELLNECAIEIMRAAEWQKLTKLWSLDCDGTTVAFDLPSDYDRLQKDSRVHLASLITPLQAYRNADEYLYDQLRLGVSAVGRWILIGGQLNVYPAQKAGDHIKFYYQKNNIVRKADDSLASTFSDDTDSFVLPDRLLRLCAIWKYREHKGLPYEQAEMDYETALAQERATDAEQLAIRLGTVRGTLIGNGRLAWPGVVAS